MRHAAQIKLEECEINKKTAAITTACVGVAATTAAYMMSANGTTMKKRTKTLRKNTGKALRQVGDFIDNVSFMMK